jgi:hypothetical protein
MNIVLTNQMTYPVPVMTKDDGGWCQTAEPGVPLTESGDAHVIIVGNKPDVSEQILEGLHTALDVLKAFIHLQKPKAAGEPVPSLSFMIGNNGPNPIRVILGDGQTDAEVAPGVTYIAHAPGYIEIRELGLVNEPGGTPD